MKEKELLKEVSTIIKERVINIPQKSLNHIYDFWNREIAEAEFDKKKYVFDKKLIREEQNLPNETHLLGIDFPRWYGNVSSENRIMIVGIDPLRTSTYFDSLKADKARDVIIGTPFALDNNDILNNRDHKNSFWHFVADLANDNFIYITDIYKTFFFKDEDKEQKNRSYNFYKRNNSLENQKTTLLKEIELIKPEIIVTFGKDTFEQLTGRSCAKLSRNINDNLIDYNENIKVIPMVHLTGGWDNSIKNFLSANDIQSDSLKTKKEYGLSYAELIKNYMNRN